MKKGIKITLAVLILLGIVGYFVFANSAPGKAAGTGSPSPTDSPSPTPNPSSTNPEPVVINVKASRFQYDQSVIKVKKGDHVKIMIDNTDTKHGMAIPDLGVSGIDSVEFTADKVGTYVFRCPTPCGPGHINMKGTLIIE